MIVGQAFEDFDKFAQFAHDYCNRLRQSKILRGALHLLCISCRRRLSLARGTRSKYIHGFWAARRVDWMTPPKQHYLLVEQMGIFHRKLRNKMMIQLVVLRADVEEEAKMMRLRVSMGHPPLLLNYL